MRLHRAMRLLADQLTRRGHHVLRFDYPGLGNSLGASEALALSTWQSATNQALNELADISGLRQFALIGIRLGAFVAETATFDLRPSKVVYWDAVARGSTFIDEMHEAIDEGYEPRANFREANGSLHFNGFYFPKRFLDDLATHSMQVTEAWRDRETLLIGSSANASLVTLAEEARALQAPVTLANDHPTLDWNKVDQMGGLLQPMDLIRNITEWL